MSIIATANGIEITREMFERSVTRYFVQLEEDPDCEFQPTPENLKYIKTEALNYLIERLLLLSRAQKSGVEIDENEVYTRIHDLRMEFETEEDWEANLQSLGVKPENLSDELRDDMILEAYFADLYGREIDVSEPNLKSFFEENRERMKEPDTFTFDEVAVSTPEQVNAVGRVLMSEITPTEKEQKLSDYGLDYMHYTDLPAFSIPEQIYNVLSEMDEGKLSTMILDDDTLVLYRLYKRDLGKRFEFSEIKEKLAVYVAEQAQKELYSKICEEEMENAEINYLDMSVLEK